MGLRRTVALTHASREVHKLSRVPDPADFQEDRISAPHGLVDARPRYHAGVPRSNVVLDEVAAIAPASAAKVPVNHPSARYTTVTFGDGRSGLLDSTDHRGRVWAEVLESLRESHRAAYVEIDAETNLITNVLLPIRYTVGRLSAAKDGLEVALVISHARHFLRRAHPQFDTLRKMLQDAQKSGDPVLVVENERQEILDVRPAAEDSSIRAPRRKSR
jgi:hypothetical protein